MHVLHVFNRHRGGGGSDNAWDATIAASRAGGIDVHLFERDSRALPPGLAGKARAFASGLYAREAVRDFADTLARLRPDVVHAHELYPLITPWIVPAAVRAGVPVVQHCYDFRLTCPVATHARAGRVCVECVSRGEQRALVNDCRGQKVESAAYAARAMLARRAGLWRGVARFVTLSPFSRDWLTANAAIAADRIAVNPCVIPAPASAADPAGGGYIAYAGRFVPEKGVEVAIAAARVAGLPLRLAGDASRHPAIRPGDDVTCVATRSREELAAFYRGARALVVPSLWFETFAIVAAEAMAHGVPVIASDIGALADTVTRDVTGLLVPPGDVAALAAAMRRLWDAPALARSLGAAGRARVLADFSAARHVERLRAIYAAVLA